VVVGVAVDVRSNHAYAQALFDPRLVPDPDDEAEPDVGPPKAAAPLASEPGDAKTGGPEEPPIVEMETSIRVYGNFDLMDFLDIPRAPATLYIHFTLGGHQSNVVRVELVTVREED
jgi:hypothetical protein